MDSRVKRITIGYTILIVLLIVLVILNICVGSADILPNRLWKAIRFPENDKVAYNIVFGLRIPRTFAAVILGGALAVAGFPAAKLLCKSYCRSIYSWNFIGSKAYCCYAYGHITF